MPNDIPKAYASGPGLADIWNVQEYKKAQAKLESQLKDTQKDPLSKASISSVEAVELEAFTDMISDLKMNVPGAKNPFATVAVDTSFSYPGAEPLLTIADSDANALSISGTGSLTISPDKYGYLQTALSPEAFKMLVDAIAAKVIEIMDARIWDRMKEPELGDREI